MGKILQKKKNRSGLSKAKAKNNRLKSGNKKINVLGNAIIAQNWDRDLTLTQNYKKLGLLHKLNAPTGGNERIPGRTDLAEKSNSLHINGSAVAAAHIDLGETKVERDPETGKILRVIHDDDEIEVAGRKRRRANPLNDPLNDLSDNEDTTTPGAPSTHIVQQLERQADLEGQGEKAKKPRHQSSREGEWISRLIEKHGDNIAAMVRDRKLNPMQQTEGDIRRRISKWQKGQA
ncbi:Nucleolar protein 16 [Penicillium canariense]|uniref:Nucleolar protein 16 n=1 Tax=Penicillium canariense TaxID=189055 RepID=A0A9W9I8I7_9EURO|nr:Nucleolar protein 16 [Penicillium canariense]KAJ5167812.1 Nucleolar protein 16 [Penicillium canariense]